MRSRFFIIGVLIISSAQASVSNGRGFKHNLCYRHFVTYSVKGKDCFIEIASDTSAKLSFKVEKCISLKLKENSFSADFQFKKNANGEESVQILTWFVLNEKAKAKLARLEEGMAFPIRCSL